MPLPEDLLAELRGVIALSIEPDDVVAHARDSWPLAMLRERRGDSIPVPHAVLLPSTVQEVADALRICNRRGVAVVPFGGGSGVCGGAAASEDSVALDMRRLSAVAIDEESCTVTAQAGVLGSDLEEQLSSRNLTLGHFPQSIEISTLGGWIATRSTGQKSTAYGRIEDHLLGATIVLADGSIVRIPARARTSAGPDLTRLLAGSEGTLAVIAEATLAVEPMPAGERSEVFVFDSFSEGLRAMKAIAQTRARPVVVRLHDTQDARIAFRDEAPNGATLVLRFEGEEPLMNAEHEVVASRARAFGGRSIGPDLAERWWPSRNAAVRTLGQIMFHEALGPHAAVETIDLSSFWPADRLYADVRLALEPLASMVACHASHPTPQGTCLYFTVVFAGCADDLEVERRYDAAMRAAMTTTIQNGGGISHHHGVGLLRAPWLESELGSSLDLWRSIKRALDPSGTLNPGKAAL